MNWIRITKKKQTLPDIGTQVLLWTTHPTLSGGVEPHAELGYVDINDKLRGNGCSDAFDWYTHYAVIEAPRKPWGVK